MTLESVSEQTIALHERTIVIDGLSGGEGLEVVVDAMLAGGVTASNWTIAGPRTRSLLLPHDVAGVVTFIAELREALTENPDRARLVETADDIRACKRDGVAGVILGFQDIGAIGEQLALLSAYHALGVRVIQIAYQSRGLWGDGSGERTDAGLSDLGREAIARMNRIGMLVDLSHVGKRTTLQAIETSSAPCSFTHASAAHFVDVPRTKSDEEIRALGARGGVMGIIGLSPYLRDRGSSGSTIDDLVDHVLHVGMLTGIDRVGIGLDIIEGLTRDAWETRMLPAFQALPGISTQDPFEFDTYYPDGLRSMRDLPHLTERLLARGLTDNEVQGVMGHNFLRLFEEVWAAHRPEKDLAEPEGPA